MYANFGDVVLPSLDGQQDSCVEIVCDVNQSPIDKLTQCVGGFTSAEFLYGILCPVRTLASNFGNPGRVLFR
jgi:hypothetical protein